MYKKAYQWGGGGVTGMSAALAKDSLSRSAGVIGLKRCILVVDAPPRLPLVLLAMPADLKVFQTGEGRGFIR